jgi:hypothetical protein
VLGVCSCAGGVAYALAQGERHSAGAPGQVAGKSARSFSIRVAPRTRVVSPGEGAKFTVRIGRRDRRKLRLRVVDGLPPGATAFLAPRLTRKSRATLTIDTGGAPSGGHRLMVEVRRGARRTRAAVNLVITPPRPTNFAIGGDLPGPLEPGLALPLDLALTNPGPAAVAITGLDVEVAAVSAPQASAAYPCSVADFAVTEFSGSYGFTLAPTSTARLSELGFPDERLPHVGMLNPPVNQNGCRGASLSLSFTGTSAGGDE